MRLWRPDALFQCLSIACTPPLTKGGGWSFDPPLGRAILSGQGGVGPLRGGLVVRGGSDNFCAAGAKIFRHPLKMPPFYQIITNLKKFSPAAGFFLFKVLFISEMQLKMQCYIQLAIFMSKKACIKKARIKKRA